MKRLLFCLTIVLLSSCASTPHQSVTADIERSITISWGMYSDDTNHGSNQVLTYQHDGIPGNLATISQTIGPNGQPLRAVVLGPAHLPATPVIISVLGLFEQAGPDGLISTVIATTGNEKNLADLETSRSGSVAVLEAGLVKIDQHQSRSLGFRSAEAAMTFINRHRR